MSDIEINDETPISDLRKAYEKLRDANKTLAEDLGRYKSKEKQSSVAEILKAKGAPAAAAKFYSGDVDEKAVSAWLEENKELFPTSAAASTTSVDTTQVVDPNTAAARALAAATSTTLGDTESLVASDGRIVGQPEELTKLMRSAPRTPEGYASLVKLGLMPKLS